MICSNFTVHLDEQPSSLSAPKERRSLRGILHKPTPSAFRPERHSAVWRRGQRQFGIDILDLTSPPPRFAAQCKADDPQLEFTEKRLRELVDDVFKAPHQIKQYVILSTGKTSTRLQNAIAEIKHRALIVRRFYR